MDLKITAAAQPFASMILAHGAGAGQTSAFMVRAARDLAERGLTVATFDFPYITAGRKVPDRAPVLEDAWRSAIKAFLPTIGASPLGINGTSSLPLFIGGKSMGGRIASQVASQGDAGKLSGLVFFGYPLHPPGKPEQRRDAHLPAISEPMLFIQGGRDPFGTGDEIRALVTRLQRATLHEIAGGDHSFKVPGGKGAQEPALVGVFDTAAAWARELIPT